MSERPTIRMRPVTMGDSATLLRWQQQTSTRRYFRNPAIPGEDAHAAWFEKRFADKRGLFEIILADDEPVGMIRFDSLAPKADGVFDVSILIDENARGRGLAAAALNMTKDRLPVAELRAEVHPDNTTSHKLFRKCGFVECPGGYIYFSPTKNKDSSR